MAVLKQTSAGRVARGAETAPAQDGAVVENQKGGRAVVGRMGCRRTRRRGLVCELSCAI